MSESPPSKQTRERSKAYPGCALEDCVRFAGMIKKALGRGTHDRESLAKAMGFSTVSGAVSPKIAALVHFGLMERTSSGYELSALSRSITDPLDEGERRKAIREAFALPTLYQEIIAKFEPDGKIPSQLATHLHRFHGITDAASTQAAEIFVSSGRYAGLLDEANNLIGAEQQSARSVVEQPGSNNSGDSPAVSSVPTTPVSPHSVPISLPAQVLSGHQRFEFAITQGRTVTLTVPSDVNAKDIKIIRKQIELLELQAGIEDDDL